MFRKTERWSSRQSSFIRFCFLVFALTCICALREKRRPVLSLFKGKYHNGADICGHPPRQLVVGGSSPRCPTPAQRDREFLCRNPQRYKIPSCIRTRDFVPFRNFHPQRVLPFCHTTLNQRTLYTSTPTVASAPYKLPVRPFSLDRVTTRQVLLTLPFWTRVRAARDQRAAGLGCVA